MKYMATIVAVLATFIIQWHSMSFWTEQAGQVGYLWSICFEAAVLWLWWQDKLRLRIVGFFGTMILLAAPLYVISAPVVSMYSAVAGNNQERVMLQERIKRLNASHEKYLSLADRFRGWQPKINEVDAKLDAAYSKLDALPPKQDGVLDYHLLALFIIELLALIIITVAQITAIRFLSVHRIPKLENNNVIQYKTKEEQQKKQAATKQDKNKIAARKVSVHNAGGTKKPSLSVVHSDNDLPIIREWLEAYIAEKGSISAASKDLGLDRREIGYTRNDGGRKPKKETLELLRKYVYEPNNAMLSA